MALSKAKGDSGTNLARVKDYNEVVVLDLIRAAGPMARPAIAAATGLTLQTVSNIARRLLGAGVVVQEPEPGSGRPRRALRVNPDAGFALGIELVRTHLAVGVVDLAGCIRGRAETVFAIDEPPADVLARLVGLVAEAVAQAGISADRLLGAGIGAPGPLDLRAGALLDVLNPPSWSGFRMRDAVAEALALPVIMDNDATAAALGERWAGIASDTDCFVYVYLGTGLGSGLVLNGQAYRGLRGNAGELSHIRAEPDGPPCECGSNGCLGLYVSPDGLLREARRVALEAPPNRPIAACPLTVEELVASDEPRYRDVVADAGRRLASVLTEVSRVLDPELVVLGGPLVSAVGDVFGAQVRQAVAQLAAAGAPAPRVEVSRIGWDAGMIGAATLVLHELYAPTARKLSLVERSAAGGADRRAA